MSYRIETNCVQAGWEPKDGEPRILPIYQSTTYKYDSAATIGEIFDLKADGHTYSRLSNPTVAGLEEKVNALEGGVAALGTASGQSANFFAVFNIASAGDNFVAFTSIYGGSVNLFAVTFKRMGIEVRFATPQMSDEEVEALFDERTRCVFGETIANPALNVFDIERYAGIAHKHNVPLIVDNTFATPILLKPFEYGADIITHSMTKYMDGSAAVMGGMIVDSGNFDWEAAGKYPELTEPDDSYHGVVYTRDFGKAAYITKARVQLMRDLGPTLSAQAAFQFYLGIDSLAVRMERHSENAMKAAEFLSAHPKVESVNFPLLPTSDQYELAKKYLTKGCCGVVSFVVKGGREKAMNFMNALNMIDIVVHVADARSCILHPASTTHRQLTDAQLEAAGIQPGMVRFSVGIENIEDILEDLTQAFDKI
ncbi:MAG: O-acetylhomoserine aminocarboxypropyltransferase/cysteine synthase [Clostridia bacterium]|nr:O-acetylhomoserine aminocarboxypropyltransferase/cysteine synthase [Clostridia bacterium]